VVSEAGTGIGLKATGPRFIFLFWTGWKGGLVNPQLRASSEHIPIVRAARAQGIDQAAV